jgi:hypothetical protein
MPRDSPARDTAGPGSRLSRTLCRVRVRPVQRFDVRFASVYRVAARPFGITPDRAWVQIDDMHLVADYGPWRLRRRLGNIAGWRFRSVPILLDRRTGAAGITDGGLTFAMRRRPRRPVSCSGRACPRLIRLG